MNIFILHILPLLCAQYHCDKHVVKMILESTQMLYFVHYMYDNIDNLNTALEPYASNKAHHKHPCTIWASESIANYKWLCELGRYLCKEYEYRYMKIHKCREHIEMLSMKDNLPPIKNKELTKFVQAMPDEYKNEEDAVTAYRKYYTEHKNHVMDVTYNKGRKAPDWYREDIKRKVLKCAMDNNFIISSNKELVPKRKYLRSKTGEYFIVDEIKIDVYVITDFITHEILNNKRSREDIIKLVLD